MKKEMINFWILLVFASVAAASGNVTVVKTAGVFELVASSILGLMYTSADKVTQPASCMPGSQPHHFQCFAPAELWGKIKVGTPRITYSTVVVYPRQLDDGYTVKGLLGEGGCGAVFDASDHNTVVVIKTNKLGGRLCTFDSLEREIIILEKLSKFYRLSFAKLNFVKPIRFIKDDYGVFQAVVLPKLDGGLLQQVRRKGSDGSSISCDYFMRVAQDVLKGLKQIHAAGVIHNDIKPENILFKDNSYFISDFGLSCLKDKSQACRGSGTPGFYHPDIFNGNPITTKTDVFSFAVTMLELVFLLDGKNLYDKPPRSYTEYMPKLMELIQSDSWLRKLESSSARTCSSLKSIIQDSLKLNQAEIPDADVLLKRYFPSSPSVFPQMPALAPRLKSLFIGRT